MSRIAGHVFTQQEFPCGRLVMTADYDSQEKIMTFKMPSLSRPKKRVYGLELDCMTAEIACGCEADDYKETYKLGRRRDVQGTYAEIAAKALGYHLLPLITRRPKGLCVHANRVRQFLKRHDLYEAMLTIQQSLENRLATMKPKGAK